jgi:hypothetical protein
VKAGRTHRYNFFLMDYIRDGCERAGDASFWEAREYTSAGEGVAMEVA